MSRWGMGPQRSVADWEAFSGVDLKHGTATGTAEKFCADDIPDEIPERVCPVAANGAASSLIGGSLTLQY